MAAAPVVESVTEHGIPERVYRLRWWTLVILNLSLVLVVMGNSSLNVALDQLGRDGFSNTDVQWLLDAYALVFGGVLLTMGALGDRFGRKGALQIGLVIFGLSSLVAALFADKPWELIALRAVQGFGAALVMPATLSILVTVFPKHEQGKAIGIWAAFAGIGGLIGIMSSGVLLKFFDWPSIFWVNIPVIAVALIAGWFLVPTSRDPHRAPLDILGSILSILALGGLLFAIIEGPNEGWFSPLILGTGIGGLLLGFVFVWWEKRIEHPMLPMSFFRERGFNAGLTVIFLTFFAMFSTFFMLSLFLQGVQGFTPLETAVRFLPMSAGMIVSAPNSDRLVRKVGAPIVVALGLLLVALAMVSFAFLEVGTAYWIVGITFFLNGIGMGLSMAPATTIVMSSIPQRKAGVGSSMNDVAREVGGAFGVAILGSILKEGYSDGVRPFVPGNASPAWAERIKDGLGGAFEYAFEVATPPDFALVEGARQAFVDGLGPAFWTAGVLVFIAAAVVVFLFPRAVVGKEGDDKPAPPPDPFLPPAPAATTFMAPSVQPSAPRILVEGSRLVARLHDSNDPLWSVLLNGVLVGEPEVSDGHVRVHVRNGGGAETIRLDRYTGRIRSRVSVRA